MHSLLCLLHFLLCLLHLQQFNPQTKHIKCSSRTCPHHSPNALHSCQRHYASNATSKIPGKLEVGSRLNAVETKQNKTNKTNKTKQTIYNGGGPSSFLRLLLTKKNQGSR